MMKQVMVRAWELAKDGAAKFGGSSKEYFAASLAIAWKECKEMQQNEMPEEKVVATFEKFGTEIKVIVTKDENIGLEAEGLRNFYVNAKQHPDMGAYYELNINAPVAKMLIEKSGKTPKKGRNIQILDASAATVKAEAKKFKDAFEAARFEHMSDDEEFVLSYSYSTHSFYTNLPKSNCLVALVNELGGMRDKTVNFLSEIGQVVRNWDEPDEYIIKKADVVKLEQFVAQAKDEYAKRLVEKEQTEAARKAALIEKAKATGEKQVLRSWTESCNCRDLECDIDHVYELIDGEGNITQGRSHSY